MTRPALALIALVALAACAGEPDADADAVPVDSLFVDALVDLQLADARAALAPDSLGRPALADSLRRAALAAHGLDADALDRQLDALADAPARARATYDAVEDRLADEQRSRTY